MTRHFALVGPTASGKSALALALARTRGDVEIVSLDSMQVYRGLDIGTAKPTVGERSAVPHHLIDVLEPHIFRGDEHACRRGQNANALRVLPADGDAGLQPERRALDFFVCLQFDDRPRRIWGLIICQLQRRFLVRRARID